MAHRIIEMLIGRLITDEQFRCDFVGNPHETLHMLRELGLELSPIEVAALINTDASVWTQAAEGLDPRLQKASLCMERRTS